MARCKHGTCVHFRGIGNNPNCAANVNYRQVVGGEDFGWSRKLPCFSDNKTEVTCDKLQFPSEEEVAASEKASLERLERISKALNAIADHLGPSVRGQSLTAQGVIDCPNCDGKLRYSRAFNGHIHGTCSTQGCCSWVQ